MLDAIVMDMDGTLLDPNNKILPETKEALIACQKQGTKLVLASGRSYTRLLSYAKELEMDVYGGYLLEVDGIAYYDVQKDERHVLKQMYKEDVEPVFAYLMHKNCETMAVFNDGLFDYIPDHIMAKKKALRNSQEYPEDFPWTGGPWSWLADMRDGYPRELEVLPKGYSKGATLVRMMDMFGWDKDKVFTFGDGENDVSMFGVVTHSFAMGQALDYVKEKAAHVTKSNVEQGIVAALKDFNIL